MAERTASSSAAGDEGRGRGAAERAASRDAASSELVELVQSARDEALAALLENPDFDQDHAALLPILLDRKNLPEGILERISKRTRWMGDAAVQRKLAAHAHTPRRVAMRLLREFHLLDLVQFSLQPATPPEARRLADELLVARIGQLPLGQKKMLARRGSAQVACALLADASPEVVAAALDNSFLTEAQVLKALARRSLEARAISAIVEHKKWSQHRAVRMAVVAHARAPLNVVMPILPELPRRDLEDLAALPNLPASAKQYFQNELARRLRAAKKPGAP
ncbi:MAG: hypothetical protein WBF06_09860 [Candidatus Acidiferrales bacterium]